MKVKIKKLSESAVIPTYAKSGDAGLDLTATVVNWSGTKLVCRTEIAVEIPEGYVGLIYPRSSISKTGLSLCNSVGVIDSGYRGEIMLKFNYIGQWLSPYTHATEISGPAEPIYKEGDKVGQLVIVPYPQIELIESEELSSTERGTGGFGSSGS